MSIMLHPDITPAALRLLWTTPAPALWVALRGGEFAGMVESRDAHFVASGSTGQVVGVFAGLPEAKRAVSAGARRPTSAPAMPATGSARPASAGWVPRH
jgi:hypothetical protein